MMTDPFRDLVEGKITAEEYVDDLHRRVHRNVWGTDEVQPMPSPARPKPDPMTSDDRASYYKASWWQRFQWRLHAILGISMQRCPDCAVPEFPHMPWCPRRRTDGSR